MSQVYSTEPQTTGRVILNTTSGPIDINLWCKECPTTTRTFLQLCLDGYYNGMIFHRIINNFLIQTGETIHKDRGVSVDEDGNEKYMSAYGHGHGGQHTGDKEETIPGSDAFMTRKKLELSPRLRFNHRGQVAMALPLDDENIDEGRTSSSLARQFFITMDEAPFLQSKYVVFGTVTGDTIFNAMRIGRTETVDEESGQLADKDNAPTIKDVRIESHLFDDLVMTKESCVPWKANLNNGKGKGDSELKKRRKKRKGKKDLNVLSFGAEMEDDDGDEIGGMRSTYDEIQSNDDGNTKTQESKKKKRRNNDTQIHEEKTKQIDKQDKMKIKNPIGGSSISYHDREERIKIDIETKQKAENQSSSKQQSEPKSEVKTKSTTSRGSQDDSTSAKQKKSPKLSAVEARRLKYLQKAKTGDSRKGSKQRDNSTMSKLSAFKSKMFEVKGDKGEKKTVRTKNKDESLAARMVRSKEEQAKSSSSSTKKEKSSAPVYSGQILEDNMETMENDGSWLKSRFKCKRHIDHDSKDSAMGGDGRNMEDYAVIDGRRDTHDNNNNGGRGRSQFHRNGDRKRR